MSRISPPPNAVRRLFIRLDGVVSLRGFEALLTWAPTAGESPAYRPSGYAAPVGTNCTWLLRGSPLTVANQTDSTLRILSAGGVNTFCPSGNVMVVNFPKYSPGQTPPGRIVLAFAVALDANNQEDILAVGPAATMKGGTTEPAPLVKGFSPPGGWVGSQTEYELDGLQFHPSMTVRLAKGLDTLSAVQTTVINSRAAKATFLYADGHQGWWNLVLTNPGGRWTGDVNTLKVIKEAPGGDGLSGSAGGTVFLHVQPGKLPLTGPRARAVADLTGADVALRDELVASGAERVRCLWPETRPHPRFAVQPDGSTEALFDFSNVYSIHFADTVAAKSAVGRLKRLDSVTGAHFVPPRLGVRGLYCTEPPLPACTGTGEATPNDPNFTDLFGNLGQRAQWYFDHSDFFFGRCNEDIQTTCAWSHRPARGHSGVIVGLVDSGIDGAHEDLAHAYQVFPGQTKILPGINFAPHANDDINPDPADITDDFGHGTNMAGLMAAITNNGGTYLNEQTGMVEGIAGVAGGGVDTWHGVPGHPDSVGARILPVRVLNHHNFLTDLGWLISGINFAAANGAKVINLSLGQYFGGDPATLPHELRDALYNAMLLGSTCVAAVGEENHNDGDPVFPAVFARWGLCVAVGASDENGERFHDDFLGAGSDFADFLDVVAPGRYIVTTQPTYLAGNTINNPYGPPEFYYSLRQYGTSFSCALASGVAASLLSVVPELRDVDIKHILRATAANPNYEVVPNNGIGYGRLDHNEAVRLVDPDLGQAIIGGTLAVADSVVFVGPLQYALGIRGVEEELGLPDGEYAAQEYRVWFSVDFANPYIGPDPLVWIKVVGTKGWAGQDFRSPDPFVHFFNYGGGAVTETSTSGATFYTTVYWLTQEAMWVPCAPSEARIRYGAVGTGGGPVSAPGPSRRVSGLELRMWDTPSRAGEVIPFDALGLPGHPVQAAVYDVRGRRLVEMEATPDGEGLARFRWLGQDRNGTPLLPGVYLIRAVQGGSAATARAVIIP